MYGFTQYDRNLVDTIWYSNIGSKFYKHKLLYIRTVYYCMVTLLQEGMSFTFNFKGVADRTMVTRVLMRVAAKNSFALGPFSEYAYLGEPDVNVIVKCNISIDAA